MAIFKTMRSQETKIYIEMRERTIVRPLPDSISGYCELCEKEAFFLMPELAAIESGLSIREIYRRVENGRVHFREFPNGPPEICRNSLNNPDRDAVRSLPAGTPD